MIMVTRLNGDEIMVNADMIEFVEVTPDTVISMVSGKKIVVTEDIDAVEGKIITYKQKIFNTYQQSSTKG